ncbi:MAG: nitroreductase family protein [Candidatus Gastranaerophilales bacterium]|nr:nitroreductase family protein [Candidatus Gastranaerophilales bacterium]
MDLIENRKSIRKYQEKNIPNDILKQVLDAGRLAPSWINVQPWHFIVVRKNKELLSELANNQPHVRYANAVIVCVADTGAWNKDRFSAVMKQKGMQDTGIESIMQLPALYPPLLGPQTTLLRTVEQVTYAIAYMTLEAERLGLGACVIGALGNEVTQILPDLSHKVKKELNLNDEQCIISMLTLGYPDDNRETIKIRKDFDEVISEEKIGQKFIV